MHKRWTPYPIFDRHVVEEARTTFPDDTRIEVGIFHEPNIWIKPADPDDALSPHDACATHQYRLVEQHSTYVRPSRAESATAGRFARCLLEIVALMLQLRFRPNTEWFNAAKNQTNIRVLFERSFDGCIMSCRDNIVVIKEM